MRRCSRSVWGGGGRSVFISWGWRFASGLIGAGVHSYGSVGMPVAATALAFIFGLLLLPGCLETRAEVLPV